MADVATTKPIKAAVPAVAQTPVAGPGPLVASTPRQSLRAAQVRRISMSKLKPVGFFYDPQQAMLPADWDFSDALKPEFWALIAPGLQANVAASVLRDRLGTVIHVHSEDHAFYGQVMVTGLRRNKEGNADAVFVTCIGPVFDPETGKCWAVDTKTGGIWKGRPAQAEAA